MGIFSRISNIISANINDMLDRAENPEAMIRQVIKDMETSAVELESSAASAIASAKMAMNKLENSNKERDLWQRNAEKAIKDGHDDLARKALMKKQAIEQNIEVYEKQANEANKLANRMKEEYQLVKEKLAEARNKSDHLIAKQKAAESRAKMNESSEKFTSTLEAVNSAYSSISESESVFSRMEDKIEKQLSEVEAREEMREESIEKEFRDMERTSKVDDELEKLKSKLGQ